MQKLLLFSILLSSTILFGQKMKFKVVGQKDTTIHLVRYYGKNLYYADTADIKGGIVEFDGKKQKPGILAVLLPGQKYFEFIYNNEDINIETEGPDFIKTMKVKKSEENKVFVDYMNYLILKRTESGKITEERSKIKDDKSAEYKTLTEKLKVISDEVDKYQLELIAGNKEKLVSKMAFSNSSFAGAIKGE